MNHSDAVGLELQSICQTQGRQHLHSSGAGLVVLKLLKFWTTVSGQSNTEQLQSSPAEAWTSCRLQGGTLPKCFARGQLYASRQMPCTNCEPQDIGPKDVSRQICWVQDALLCQTSALIILISGAHERMRIAMHTERVISLFARQQMYDT